MKHHKLAVIVHRWGGSPASDWYPWLKCELERRDYDVLIPAMPNTDEPTIAAWVGALRKLLQDNSAEDLLLVGHSVGCQTILRALAETEIRAAKAIFVAGWVELTGLEDEEMPIADPWLHEPFDVAAAASHVGSSIALFSADDPVVPASNQTFFKDTVGSQIVVLENRGHFDEDSGVTMIPELLTCIGREH